MVTSHRWPFPHNCMRETEQCCHKLYVLNHHLQNFSLYPYSGGTLPMDQTSLQYSLPLVLVFDSAKGCSYCKIFVCVFLDAFMTSLISGRHCMLRMAFIELGPMEACGGCSPFLLLCCGALWCSWSSTPKHLIVKPVCMRIDSRWRWTRRMFKSVFISRCKYSFRKAYWCQTGCLCCAQCMPHSAVPAGNDDGEPSLASRALCSCPAWVSFYFHSFSLCFFLCFVLTNVLLTKSPSHPVFTHT